MKGKLAKALANAELIVGRSLSDRERLYFENGYASGCLDGARDMAEKMLKHSEAIGTEVVKAINRGVTTEEAKAKEPPL